MRYGLLCFFVGFAVCFLLRPVGLINNAGLSFYGTMIFTIAPYIIAILGPSYYFVKFAKNITDPDLVIVKYALISFSVFMLGLAITPYTAGRFVADAHLTCGALLFSLQLLLSGWFMIQLQFAAWAVTCLVLEFLAGFMSFLYLNPKHGYLTETQFIFQVCFSILAFYSFTRLLSRKQASKVVH